MICDNLRGISSPPRAKREMAEGIRIGATDNGYVYLGNGMWQDTEDGRVYDAKGNMLKARGAEPHKKSRRILDAFAQMPGFDSWDEM